MSSRIILSSIIIIQPRELIHDENSKNLELCTKQHFKWNKRIIIKENNRRKQKSRQRLKNLSFTNQKKNTDRCRFLWMIKFFYHNLSSWRIIFACSEFAAKHDIIAEKRAYISCACSNNLPCIDLFERERKRRHLWRAARVPESEGETSVGLETTRPRGGCFLSRLSDPSALARLSLAACSKSETPCFRMRRGCALKWNRFSRIDASTVRPQQQAIRVDSSRTSMQPLQRVCFHSRSLCVGAEPE